MWERLLIKFLEKAKDLTLFDILYGFVKLAGWFMVFQAIPRRAEARSIVQNYILQLEKKHWLTRLWQRNPLWDGSEGWWLDPSAVGHGAAGPGYIAYRKVTVFQFYWTVFTTWGWLDDDSNEDTTDWGHISRHHPPCLEGEVKPKWGNTFDLGDFRAKSPFYKRCATWWWNQRNSAMNFQYLWRKY